MASKALIIPPVDVKMNPLPYGQLHVRKGAWDQLQAQRAYEDGDAVPARKQGPALDRSA